MAITFAFMSVFISPLYTFPPISWWSAVQHAEVVILDTGEAFQKMSYRNRYRISGSNNPVLLSLPLVKGRSQRTAFSEILISNAEPWQIRHWRTLVSVYKRTPFFEYYEPSLANLYEKDYDKLIDFNTDALNWVKQQLKLPFRVQTLETASWEDIEKAADLRRINTFGKDNAVDFPRYYQLFEERIGFQPDLSILDLLFAEGNFTRKWLEQIT